MVQSSSEAKKGIDGGLQTAWLYCILLIPILVFFLTYFNRFAGIRSGSGEFLTGWGILHGHLPYRDYFTTAPPLNGLKSAFILKVFDESLVASRVAGVLERLVMGGILFAWLRRIVRPYAALVASIVAIILSAGDRTDPIASYNHDSILFAMLSGLFASLSLKQDGRTGWRWAAPVLSGAMAALSLLTKQTVGLGELIGILIAMAILIFRLDGVRAAGRWVALSLLGSLLPIGAVLGVLAHLHLLQACLHMLFVAGPAAKGGHLSDLLVREGTIAYQNLGWVLLGLLALAAAGRTLLTRTDATNRQWTGHRLLKAGGLTMAGLLVSIALAVGATRLGWEGVGDFTKSSVYFTFAGLTLLLTVYIGRSVLGPVTRAEAQKILLCTICWIVAFTLSLSWPAFEAMLLPGLGFLLALLLDRLRSPYLKGVVAFCGFLVFMQTAEKLALPFGFDGMDEAGVRSAQSTSSQPLLRGLKLPAETVRFLDGSAAAAAALPAGQGIYTYPEMSLLYGLTGRTPPTIAWSHNFDTANDQLAREEAQRLLAHPPGMLVYARTSPESLAAEERLWRKGRVSGQREIIGAIEAMLPHYKLVQTYHLTPGGPPIEVYVRSTTFASH